MCEEVLETYAVEVLEADMEGVQWVMLSQENEECLMLAVCYIPLEYLSRGRARGERNLPTVSRIGG